jgi:hypothetical protein
MIRARRSTIFLAILTLEIAGCVSEQVPEPGFWIYVPKPSIDAADSGRGNLALVVLPARRYTTNRMDLSVTGEVRAPGAIKPPQGCTVFEAIGYAGGFTDFAFPKRLSLGKATGQRLRLYLQSEVQDRFGHRRVWYGLDKFSRTDYVLEAGDELHIPRPNL